MGRRTSVRWFMREEIIQMYTCPRISHCFCADFSFIVYQLLLFLLLSLSLLLPLPPFSVIRHGLSVCHSLGIAVVRAVGIFHPIQLLRLQIQWKKYSTGTTLWEGVSVRQSLWDAFVKFKGNQYFFHSWSQEHSHATRSWYINSINMRTQRWPHARSHTQLFILTFVYINFSANPLTHVVL